MLKHDAAFLAATPRKPFICGAARLLVAMYACSASLSHAENDTTTAAIESGKQTYNAYCITCHGPNMVNFGTRAPDLRKFPAEDRARFNTIVNEGKGAMPAWGKLLDADAVAQLWEYVKSGG